MKLLSLFRLGLIFVIVYLIFLGFVLISTNFFNSINLQVGLFYWLALEPSNAFIEIGIPLPLFVLLAPFAIIFNNGIIAIPGVNMVMYLNNIILYFLLGFLIKIIGIIAANLFRSTRMFIAKLNKRKD